jgi:DnaJ-class molecular chaperone
MKKLIMKLSERNCPECMGAGFTMVDHPSRPGVKIYQECKECRGKGRFAAS